MPFEALSRGGLCPSHRRARLPHEVSYGRRSYGTSKRFRTRSHVVRSVHRPRSCLPATARRGRSHATAHDHPLRVSAPQSGSAAVIVEPTGAAWGALPIDPEFLHGLREVTRATGTVLIFDEVITGFRCSPGGAQEVYGIAPDLTTLAKILAGGLPGGAVCGKLEIMDIMRFGETTAWNRGGRISH
ncbi:MAG: aminotransferase class III-fold pyridoxal phosphate-dependent enzyme, partial [Proteobacteria bacterium]|nr:aminotransferase class III-fold pyridoxal phosphate-dependent enzyme [Pseudomonadota bacterium]